MDARKTRALIDSGIAALVLTALLMLAVLGLVALYQGAGGWATSLALGVFGLAWWQLFKDKWGY